MKKRLVIAILTAAVVSTACTSSKNDKTSSRKSSYKESRISSSSVHDESDISKTTNSKLFNMLEYGNTPLIAESDIPYNGYKYSFKNIFIILPDTWKDIVTIEEYESGFQIIQNSSLESGYGGNLFSINIYNGMPEYINNGTIIAYTPDYCITAEYPSDVPFNYEDEAISDEYCMLQEQISMVLNSLYVEGDNVNYKCSEYILPMSEYSYISNYTLDDLSISSLYLAKYEIYARHGLCVTNDQPIAHECLTKFRGTTWYYENKHYDDSCLNKYELKNIESIDNKIDSLIHDESATFIPVCVKLNESIDIDLNGDGRKEHFTFHSGKCPNSKQETNELMPAFTIDEDEYEVWDYEQFCVQYDSPAEECYITDIDISDNTKEIAILDYGMSDDYMTHFYSVGVNNEVRYIGSVPGFPAASALPAITGDRSISTHTRTNVLGTGQIMDYYSYDGNELANCSYGLLPYYPASQHTLLCDLDVLLSTGSPSVAYTLHKGDQVWATATNNNEWLKLRTKTGLSGYVRLIDSNIEVDGETISADEIFSNINYAD